MTGSGKKKRITTRGNGQMLKGRIEHTKMYRHDNSEHNSDEERNERIACSENALLLVPLFPSSRCINAGNLKKTLTIGKVSKRMTMTGSG